MSSQKQSNKRRHITACCLAIVVIVALFFPNFSTFADQSDSSNHIALASKSGTKTAANTTGHLIKTTKASYRVNGIKGIDVSKWQGSINWKKVAGDDIKYTFIRATYGTKRDAYFHSNATAAHSNGIKVGAYHYARFKNQSEMKKEAAAFLAQLKRVKITYPVVLDIEQTNGLNKSDLSKFCKEFMDVLKKEGYEVMLYSYQNFITKNLDVSQFKGYNLWVANYLTKPSGISHKIWQYTSKGKVSGISGNVDINISYDKASGGTKVANATVRATPIPVTAQTEGTDSNTFSRASVSGKSTSGSADSGEVDGDTFIKVNSAKKAADAEKAKKAAEAAAVPALVLEPHPVPENLDKEILNQVKTYLNTNFATEFPEDQELDIVAARAKISTILQNELNAVYPVGSELAVVDILGKEQLDRLEKIDFNQSYTKIIGLTQAQLFLIGKHNAAPTGVCDEATRSSIAEYQGLNSLPQTGEPCRGTFQRIYAITA